MSDNNYSIENGSPIEHLGSMSYSATPERCRNLSGITMDSGLDTSSPNFKSPYHTPRKPMNMGNTMGPLNSTPIRRQSFPDGGMESKTNLIVNYLPQSMTSDNLRDLFQSIGAIENCKLCRNKDTKQSLGYGFVNYRCPDDAQKAVDQLNGRPIQNKMIKVSFARPSSQHIKNTNLYVAGLPKTFTNIEIKKLFGQVGKIISCRILHCKETGLSRGVAFVRFDTRNEAELAVKRLNQTAIAGYGETITVKFANPIERAEQVKGKSENDFCSGDGKNTKGLEAVFSQMLLSKMQNIQQMNVGRQFGRSISNDLRNVHRGMLSGNQPNCPVLISVSNLTKDVTEKQIWELFGPFGAVTNVVINRTVSEQEVAKEGYIATVTMPIYDEALCAIMSVNQAEVDGLKVKVQFKVRRM